MSATKSANGNTEVAAALELLAEYTEKLREFREKIAPHALRAPSYGPSLIAEWKKFINNHINIFEDLDRNVSQSIEFKPLHPLDKINLTLKLHEFERELEKARQIATQ